MDGSDGPRGIDAGTLVAAVGAIALLVGLFLDWYAPPGGFGGEPVSAWTVFEIVDLLLALLAVAVLVAVAEGLTGRALLPSVPSVTIAAAGMAALVLIVVSLVDEPPAATNASLDEGIWISFGGALLIFAGAILGRTRIRLVVTPREEPVEPEPLGDELDEYAERHEDETETREYPQP
jgi:hypothetical protein